MRTATSEMSTARSSRWCTWSSSSSAAPTNIASVFSTSFVRGSPSSSRARSSRRSPATSRAGGPASSFVARGPLLRGSRSALSMRSTVSGTRRSARASSTGSSSSRSRSRRHVRRATIRVRGSRRRRCSHRGSCPSCRGWESRRSRSSPRRSSLRSSSRPDRFVLGGGGSSSSSPAERSAWRSPSPSSRCGAILAPGRGSRSSMCRPCTASSGRDRHRRSSRCPATRRSLVSLSSRALASASSSRFDASRGEPFRSRRCRCSVSCRSSSRPRASRITSIPSRSASRSDGSSRS